MSATFKGLKTALALALDEAAQKLGAPAGSAQVIEKPPQADWGDLGSSLALGLAKSLRKPPKLIAEDLARTVETPEGLENPEVKGAGYVNFRISPALWRSLLASALRQGPGSSGAAPGGGMDDWNIEFVSANPTGPLNVVNGRAAAVGDLISSLLEFRGLRVCREYYFNDSGKQAALFGESLVAAARRLKGEEAPAPEGGYGAPYVEDLAKELGIKPDHPPAQAARAGMARVMEWQKASLGRYNLEFGRWTSEQSIHDSGRVQSLVEELVKTGETFEEGGALHLRTTKFGDQRDRVIRRSDADQRVTYLVPDLAYQLDKMKRARATLTLLGPDHQGQIPSLKAGLKILQPQGLTEQKAFFMVIQQVNLLKDGKPYKMGKRKGMFVTLDELLDEVGVDAARWFFSSRAMETPLDFDLDLARLKTDENPVYYVQYAHARLCSIFREAAKRGVKDLEAGGLAGILEGLGGTELTAPEEKVVLNLVLSFPEVIEDASQPVAFPVHRLPAYLVDLARSFHGLYGNHRILGSGPDELPRLALCMAVKTRLARGLSLMKVAAPDTM